jgi:hypothetical protein
MAIKSARLMLGRRWLGRLCSFIDRPGQENPPQRRWGSRLPLGIDWPAFPATTDLPDFRRVHMYWTQLWCHTFDTIDESPAGGLDGLHDPLEDASVLSPAGDIWK